MQIGSVLFSIAMNAVLLLLSVWIVARKEAHLDAAAILNAVIAIAVFSSIFGFLFFSLPSLIVFGLYFLAGAFVVWKYCYVSPKRSLAVSIVFGILSQIALAAGKQFV